MSTVKVKLPDGSIIRLSVPKDATPEQIREFAKQHATEKALVERLLKRIRVPKDGEPGKKGEPGKDGISIKGNEGEPGIDGEGKPGKKGAPGKDGVSIVNVKINKKKELIVTLSDGKKINAGKITEGLASDLFEVFYTNPLKNTVNLGNAKGDLAVFNGHLWLELAAGNPNQHLVINATTETGLAWQEKVFSYLVDESNNILVDEAGNALEGKDAAEMDYSISPFTKNSVLFVTTGGAITEDNDNFKWDGTTFTVGGNFSLTGNVTAGTWKATEIAVLYGGTGQTSYTNGQLLIGNTTGNTLTKATLTAGTGIGITNGTGSITIATDGTETLTHSEKTDDYPYVSTDQVIIWNITTAKVATLLDPTGNSGKTFAAINKYTSTANLTFSRNIDGDSSFALLPGEVINFMSDGTEYLIHQ